MKNKIIFLNVFILFIFSFNFSYSESRFGELTEMRDERMRGKDGKWVRPHPGPFVWNKIEKKQGNSGFSKIQKILLKWSNFAKFHRHFWICFVKFHSNFYFFCKFSQNL